MIFKLILLGLLLMFVSGFKKGVVKMVLFIIFIVLAVGLIISKNVSTITAGELDYQTVRFEYIPTVGYEMIDGIKPDEIVDLDEFNRDACYIAQTMWGECRGLSKYEQSLVVWCILNRVDDGRMGTNVYEVVSRPNQFIGYSPNNPVDQNLYNMAVDVMLRWSYERYSVGDVGRTLPKEYLFFFGADGHNWFRTGSGTDEVFKFTTADPYKEADNG